MNDLLAQKASIIVQWIIEQSKEDTDRLIKVAEKGGFDLVDCKIKFTKNTHSLVLHEFIFFYLYLCDLYIYPILKEQRDEFQNAVCWGVIKTVGFSEEEVDMFIETYNNRQLMFSKCKKMIADSNESPAGTLFWEFGKFISTLICGLDSHITIIMAIKTTAVHAWTKLFSLRLF